MLRYSEQINKIWKYKQLYNYRLFDFYEVNGLPLRDYSQAVLITV